MKLSFTTFACPNWTLKQILRSGARLGYQGVEFRTDAQHGHGVEVWTSVKERRHFREQIERADLRVSCIASSIQFTEDEIVGRALERVKLAADMGAEGMRAFCGPLPAGDFQRSRSLGATKNTPATFFMASG